MIIKKYKLTVSLFILLAVIGFLTLGLPGLKGEIDIQTYSDSLTYERLSRDMPTDVPIISASSNLVGPIAILRAFNYSYPLIFAFNIMIFLISLNLLFNHYDVNKNVFLFFICMSPLIFFSLFNVNKEILVVLDMALFLSYLKNRSLLYLLLALVVSLLIRWQMTLFMIVALPLIYVDKHFPHRKMMVAGLVVAISIVYPMLATVFDAIIRHSLPNNDVVRGSGIFQRLNEIQNSIGGYILVFIPKLLQINFGLVKRIHLVTDLSLFWNYFVLLLHSAASLLLTMYLFYKRRFTFDNLLIYLSMIYAAMFAITPIINVRYFLPIYVIFVVVVSSRNTEFRREPKTSSPPVHT